MREALVGAGGWGYFRGGLEGYARAFRFVEVNATFYRPIPEGRARTWRARVPADFVFSVKGSREVSHVARLRATPASRAAFAGTLRTATLLRASYVVLETPASVPLDARALTGLRDLAGMVPSRVRLGLEARAHAGGPLPREAMSAMERLGVLDVVDLSRQDPRVPADEVYTRLFGRGEHNRYEFDDAELRGLDRAGRDAVRVAFTFHGVRMYRDAARFLTFRRTGTFPSVTESTGLASLEEAIARDGRFPTDRMGLLREQGWKVFDADPETRIHASEVLADLPERTYRGLEEVLEAVRKRGPLGPGRGLLRTS